MFSALSHPTVHAARHSVGTTMGIVTGRVFSEQSERDMQPKLADYLMSVATLIFATTLDPDGWMPLDCDHANMPMVDPFRIAVGETVQPILIATPDNKLPKGSFRE